MNSIFFFHFAAIDLRKHAVFKFFPAMCPDGIFLGNSRCTLVGADLNRSWNTANEFHHPVLWKVKQHIMETHDVCNCTLKWFSFSIKLMVKMMKISWMIRAQSAIFSFHSHTHSGYSSQPLADFLPTCLAQAVELW